jgi:hypothetical protein
MLLFLGFPAWCLSGAAGSALSDPYRRDLKIIGANMVVSIDQLPP